MKDESLFLTSTKTIKQLSKEELNNYFIKMHSGDLNSRNIIIEHNIGLVASRVLKRFKTFYYEYDDLASIGMIGLIKAVDNFNILYGYSFSSFAVKLIDNEILMYLRKKSRTLNLIGFDDIIPNNNDDYENIFDILSTDQEDFTNIIEEKELIEKVKIMIENLRIRDKEIINMYFGFSGKSYLQKEIAEKYNITQSAVAKIISNFIDNISYELFKDGYIEKKKSKKIKRKNK